MRRRHTLIEANVTAALRLLLVTDHDETRRQIAQLLRAHFIAVELAEAIDRAQAVTLTRSNPIHAVIIDLELAHDDAIALAMELRRDDPKAGVILLTRIGQEALASADLPLAGLILVSMRELAAQLPQAVVAAVKMRCGPASGPLA